MFGIQILSITFILIMLYVVRIHVKKKELPRAEAYGWAIGLVVLGVIVSVQQSADFIRHLFAVTRLLDVLVIIALMGTFAYRATPKESFPELAIPIIAVNTIYPGVSPADVESQVTRVIEEDLSTISDVKELTSTSIEPISCFLSSKSAIPVVPAAMPST